MISIRPLEHLDQTVAMPGSKSCTQRAMAIAALARGESLLKNVLFSEDTLILADALRALGVDVEQKGADMIVQGGAILPAKNAIMLGDNGTALRLLASITALGKGHFILTGSKRLCERPLKPLLDALATVGIESHTEREKGFPPVTIRGAGLRGGKVIFRDIQSSQYVSSLLIAAPYAAGDITVSLEGRTPSQPYIDLTIETMEAFGAKVHRKGRSGYVVKSGLTYRHREYPVEGDASSASYFSLAAAVTKGRIRVQNVRPETAQGDIGFLSILEGLGQRVIRNANDIEVLGAELPNGDRTFDMGNMPDIVPTLAVLSALRKGKSTITNIAHLRWKESDRIRALASELRKTGVAAEELPDALVIEGGNPHGARIETYDDHRIAMSFAVLGLAVEGIEIENHACVGKSFPGFWQILRGLDGQNVES